jgi:hypothetical protein
MQHVNERNIECDANSKPYTVGLQQWKEDVNGNDNDETNYKMERSHRVPQTKFCPFEEISTLMVSATYNLV